MAKALTRYQQGEIEGLLRAQRLAVLSAAEAREEDDPVKAEVLEEFASSLVGVRRVLGDPLVQS